MPAQVKGALRVNGLLLGRTSEQVDSLVVVAGRNFMPYLEGPKSHWGNKLKFKYDVLLGKYVGVFRHDGRTIYIDEHAVFEMDCETCELICKFKIPCNYEERKNDDWCYPWSSAYVGETYFYSHPSVGIITFDTFTGDWTQMDIVENGFSDLIFGITQANGSLIVLSRDTVTWSAFDRGQALLECEWDGIGSQNLHLARNGKPLGVYSDGQGFFTFTTNGTMYSRPLGGTQILAGENIESQAVFRHDTFSIDELVPAAVGPYAITQIATGRVAMITKRGLFQAGRFDNNQFTQGDLDPAFSRWLREDLFPCFPHQDCDAIRITYDGDEDYLYVSLKEYDKSGYDYAIYREALVRDMGLEEWGIFNRTHRFLGPTAFNGEERNAWGYVDEQNYVHEFHPNLCYSEDFDFGAFLKRPLDSYIDIGNITNDTTEYADYLSEIDGIVLHMNGCPKPNFGICVISGIASCYASDAQSCEPYLHDSRNCVFYYTCSNQGVNHILRLTAKNDDECFLLKTVRYSLTKKGRL